MFTKYGIYDSIIYNIKKKGSIFVFIEKCKLMFAKLGGVFYIPNIK